MRALRIVIVSLVILSLCFSIYVHGADVIDFERSGSVTVDLECGGEAVAGGSVEIYHVADLEWADDEYTFVFTPLFEGGGLSLEKLDSAEACAEYLSYVKKNSVEGTKNNVDANGKVTFSSLPLGLYLVVQTEAARGYSSFEPFLITVPVMNEDDLWEYDVDASPKVEIYRESEETTVPPQNDDDKIAQTGQLKWPVPVLVSGGLLLFVVGWLLFFSRKKNRNEK